MRFFCIADKESSLGFKLAGVETREASGRAAALESLRVALATEDVGVILITEKVSSYIPDETYKLIYDPNGPLVLEVPSRGLAAKRKTTGEFLKEAIGVSL
jgi:V/A-type H+-transporting ATPase subunit F